jgi:(1->4)-alpha-D-glucan 1-alpha-D-glucosylmutase
LGFAARARGRAADAPEHEVRRRDMAVAHDLVAHGLGQRPKSHAAVREVVAALNADADRLDPILDAQHHRFTRWQVAVHEIDYRRFFDVNSLVALRADRRDVFARTHELVAQLVRRGAVDGVRIDHVDGLRDPDAYLAWLRDALGDRTWLVVEKILRPGERMPSDWPVDGTTGYDFAAAAAGLFVDPVGLEALTEPWSRFTGGDVSYEATRIQARREVLREGLGADLERVVSLLVRVCERHRRWRDFTRAELRTALFEVAIHAPGYRSYVRPDAGGAGAVASASDEAFVVGAVTGAKAEPTIDPVLLDFVEDLLLGRVAGDVEAELTARFQQLTPPLAAKGEEDTAFYRWTRCLVGNEVGAEPDQIALTPAAFHEAMADVAEHYPRTMLTATTHDTKRSQDVRARLALLTEIPERWTAAVSRWSAANARHRSTTAEGLAAPDGAAEWLIYQVLVGSHPLSAERAWPVVEKSLREAKQRTSWLRPDAAYEEAVHEFLTALSADQAFTAGLDAFVAPLVEPGWINALSMLALQLVAPGVPDVYQGSETWDDRLVDPDNRGPVDLAERAAQLERVRGRTAAQLWADPSHRAAGLPKLALLAAGLKLRRSHVEALGAAGAYVPLPVEGAAGPEGAVLGLVRGGEVAVAVPRLLLNREAPGDSVRVVLPAGRWHNRLTDQEVEGGRAVPWPELRGGFPVALLDLPG